MKVPHKWHTSQSGADVKNHFLASTILSVSEVDRQLSSFVWLVQVQLDLVQYLGSWRLDAGVQLLNR